MNALQGLIFDVDGTLANTEEVHRLAFNATFEQNGLDWHWDTALYADLLAISGGRERMLAYARSRRLQPPAGEDLQHYCQRLHADKTARYQRMLDEGRLALRPGVRRLIDEARDARLKLALATSTSRANVTRLLDGLLPPEWPQWFDAFVGSEDVPEKKPSGAVYREALRRLSLPASACVAIEDTVNGLRAAREAGLKTVITTQPFTEGRFFPGASLVVDQLGEPDRPCRVALSRIGPVTCVGLGTLRRTLATPNPARFRLHGSSAYATAL